MASDILTYALRDSGNQLKNAFAGLVDLDSKVAPTQMSPRETLEHLAEVYQAFLTESGGGKHEWGTYEVPAEGKEDPLGFAMEMRQRAVAHTEQDDSPETAKRAMDFIALHDAYHVGQMVQHRLQMEPGWDSYAIYKGD